MSGANDDAPSPEHEDQIIARMRRRIRGAIAHPSKTRTRRKYLVTRAEDFWDRHLADLVNDSLGMGVARTQGLDPFNRLVAESFRTTHYLTAGYIQLAGEVNNFALTRWPTSSARMAPKVQALVQLHARALISFEEISLLTFTGFPSGASSLARTLHEVRVVAAFLHRFEARLSERYLASHLVELWHTRLDYAPSGPARRSRQWVDAEHEMETRYKTIIDKFGPGMNLENGWALPRFQARADFPAKPRRISFAQIEKEVQRPNDRAMYRSASKHVHASRAGSILALRGSEAEVALLGPRPFGLQWAAIKAMWDVQDVAESLLRTCGKATGETEIYYWLEALDQLAYVIRGSVTEAQNLLDSVFSETDEVTHE